MSFKVIGCTVETEGLSSEQLLQAKIFSGKNAGICYMKDSYFNSAVSDPSKALPRFISTAGNAHHSIADHVRVEVLFEGVSKMLAIVLNSLQDYSTSEKSGRYTVMAGNSKEEQELYNKWLHIFKNHILDIEPSLDDNMLASLMSKKGHDGVIIENGKLCNESMADSDDVHQGLLKECKLNTTLPSTKLAQENARYILSVFTRSTTMGYSTSIRQWNYIYDWCIKYMKNYVYDFDKDEVIYAMSGNPVSYFEKELYKDFDSLSTFIKENLYITELRDTKDRCFEFLVQYSGDDEHPMSKYDVSCFEPDGYTGEYMYSENDHSKDDNLGLTYSVAYPASLVHIAQAERHRTLKYFMLNNFSQMKTSEFFVPAIIKGTSYEEEWLNDLESVAELVPQATMVCIIETGHIADFVLKCKERLCGRAQYEIMKQTALTAKRFIDEADKDTASAVFKAYADQLKGKAGDVTTKCELCGGCKEPCRYGAKGALTRRF